MDHPPAFTVRHAVILLGMLAASAFVGVLAFLALRAIGFSAVLALSTATIPAFIVLFVLSLIRLVIVLPRRQAQSRRKP